MSAIAASERRGDHHGDSLRDLLHESHVALRFLIPGVARRSG